MREKFETTQMALLRKGELEAKGHKVKVSREMVTKEHTTYSNKRDCYGQVIRKPDGSRIPIRTRLVQVFIYWVDY